MLDNTELEFWWKILISAWFSQWESLDTMNAFSENDVSLDDACHTIIPHGVIDWLISSADLIITWYLKLSQRSRAARQSAVSRMLFTIVGLWLGLSPDPWNEHIWKQPREASSDSTLTLRHFTSTSDMYWPFLQQTSETWVRESNQAFSSWAVSWSKFRWCPTLADAWMVSLSTAEHDLETAWVALLRSNNF